uniref:FBA_2 domain-containing protein n=1 Tax=Panagrellus redivivus TaxID=6233 RepID=A0A7E4UTE9_PANRE
MPIILQPYSTKFEQGELRLERIKYSMEVPPANGKTIIIAQANIFSNSSAGTLTKYINRRVFCADLYHAQSTSSSFTPAELFYLAKHSRKCFSFSHCTVTETVDFFNLWPLLKRFDHIDINIRNLVLDEKKTPALLYRPCDVRTSSFIIYNCSLDENVIMAFIECFLKSPKFPTFFEWILKNEFQDVSLQPISDKIKTAMTTAGYVWDVKNGKGMKDTVYETYNPKSLLVRTNGKVFHVLMLPHV